MMTKDNGRGMTFEVLLVRGNAVPTPKYQPSARAEDAYRVRISGSSITFALAIDDVMQQAMAEIS